MPWAPGRSSRSSTAGRPSQPSAAPSGGGAPGSVPIPRARATSGTARKNPAQGPAAAYQQRYKARALGMGLVGWRRVRRRGGGEERCQARALLVGQVGEHAQPVGAELGRDERRRAQQGAQALLAG